MTLVPKYLLDTSSPRWESIGGLRTKQRKHSWGKCLSERYILGVTTRAGSKAGSRSGTIKASCPKNKQRVSRSEYGGRMSVSELESI